MESFVAMTLSAMNTFWAGDSETRLFFGAMERDKFDVVVKSEIGREWVGLSKIFPFDFPSFTITL